MKARLGAFDAADSPPSDEPIKIFSSDSAQKGALSTFSSDRQQKAAPRVGKKSLISRLLGLA